jgi:hypothetical protein
MALEDYTEEQRNNMAATLDAMYANPATREIALRATKTVNPRANIPEIDLKDATAAELKPRDEKIESLENQLRERDARDNIERARASLREAGHTKDDVSAIEKLMTEKQIPSYETAAEYYKGQKQLATPTPSTGIRSQTMRLPQEPLEAMKNGKNGMKNWARDQATAALDDLRAGRITLPH